MDNKLGQTKKSEQDKNEKLIELSDDGIKRDKLEQLSKEQLVEFIMSNKHRIVQNKDKNVPFIDANGNLHRKEHSNKKEKKKIDFSKVT